MTSRSLHGEPPKSPRPWRFALVLAILIAVLGVFAWQQGGDGGSGPLNAIAAAAEKTQQEPGGRAVMRSVVRTPGQSPVAMTGRMVYDAEERTQAVITVPGTASDGPMKLESVSEGTVMYVRSEKFGTLPGGAEWMKIDLSLGDDLDTPATNADAKGELALLEAAGHVRKLGVEEVRGVPTTRYGGTISTAEQIERMQEEGADDLASVAAEQNSPLRVEAWIDGKSLVRRMRLVHTEPLDKSEGDGPTTMDMRVDFIDFGIEPEIYVPDSSEVFDATAVTRENLGLSNE